MSIADFPSNLSIAIQQGYLQKEWEDNLQAELGYRSLAKKEVYNSNVGETVTRTRPGLLASNTTPLNPATNTNLDNGLTPQYWTVEQYTMVLNEYADTLDLNIVTQKVGIMDQFLKNASRLAEQARRSLDLINRGILFDAYMSGNTMVTVTLGAPALTIAVDDVRGFIYTIPTSGANTGKPLIPTTPTNTQPVVVGSNVYTLVGATIDVVNTSSAAIIGGISGTLTFSANVLVADGTAGNAVISAFAPTMIRPNGRLTTADLISTDVLTLDVCRQAVEVLYNSNIPGPYRLTIPPKSLTELYRDPEFQLLFRGTEFKSSEYKKFWLTGEVLGFDISVTQLAPIQTLGALTIQRPILTGEGALIEGEFAGASAVLTESYGSEIHDIVETDNIFMVTRTPIDRIAQIIAQSWFFIGGWSAPTDQTINSSVIPTSTNAYYKRGVVIETA